MDPWMIQQMWTPGTLPGSDGPDWHAIEDMEQDLFDVLGVQLDDAESLELWSHVQAGDQRAFQTQLMTLIGGDSDDEIDLSSWARDTLDHLIHENEPDLRAPDPSDTLHVVKPKLKLVGQDGNAFAILGLARRAAQTAGWPPEKVKEYMTKA